MGDIKVLSPLVADMIAAGEVLERPCSAVKELVENAIDAKANMITVEIKNGGTTFLRVNDNGSGIKKADVPIAFLSHATSKIRNQEDLSGIITLGFRGEALSSIASVCKIEVITKHRDETVGTHMIIEGGTIVSNEDIGCPDGTTIIMRNLFYNVPARQKFLKKDQTEAAYISEMVGKFILAYPNVSIRYINNGKEELFSSGNNNPLDSCLAVFGSSYAKQLLEVSREEDGIRIYGLVGPSSATRGNRAYECFFVNGRYVKNRLFSVAVETAFGQKLQRGRFPICALHIEVNPKIVDVNVHPQKLEVKFSNDKLIFDAIYWSIMQSLKSSETAYVVQNAPKNINKYSKAPQTEASPIVSYEEKSFFSEQVLPKQEPINKLKINRETSKAETLSFHEAKASFFDNSKNEDKNPASYKSDTVPIIQKTDDINIPHAAQITVKNDEEPNIQEINESFDDIRLVGQLFDTYIIVEKKGEMLLIDQHAAHERINYNKLIKSFQEGSVYSQLFMEPVLVDLSATEKDILLVQKDFFEKAGFSIEEFGNQSILVRQAPFAADPDTVREMILELVDALKDNREKTIFDKQKKALYSIACKSSVKGNQKLSQEELLSLCKEALSLDKLETCPHGRPIVITFTKYFIEKQFKRV